jgi:hypothetical protein
MTAMGWAGTAETNWLARYPEFMDASGNITQEWLACSDKADFGQAVRWGTDFSENAATLRKALAEETPGVIDDEKPSDAGTVWLSAIGAARQVGVSDKTMRDWISSKKIEILGENGTKYQFRLKELDTLRNSRPKKNDSTG